MFPPALLTPSERVPRRELREGLIESPLTTELYEYKNQVRACCDVQRMAIFFRAVVSRSRRPRSK